MPIEILLVEDNPGDVRLTREILHDTHQDIHLSVACDGVEAVAFLMNEGIHINAARPDLILLDLNMPRMDGYQVLVRIKTDENLKTIPTVILTTSQAETDVAETYRLHANCYVRKPVDLETFENLIRSISNFWLKQVMFTKNGGKEALSTIAGDQCR